MIPRIETLIEFWRKLLKNRRKSKNTRIWLRRLKEYGINNNKGKSDAEIAMDFIEQLLNQKAMEELRTMAFQNKN